MDNLTDDERQHLMDSLESIEEALQETYGEYADYKIYLDGEHKAEFTASKG